MVICRFRVAQTAVAVDAVVVVAVVAVDVVAVVAIVVVAVVAVVLRKSGQGSAACCLFLWW